MKMEAYLPPTCGSYTYMYMVQARIAGEDKLAPKHLPLQVVYLGAFTRKLPSIVSRGIHFEAQQSEVRESYRPYSLRRSMPSPWLIPLLPTRIARGSSYTSRNERK